jgi:hypothetical protein
MRSAKRGVPALPRKRQQKAENRKLKLDIQIDGSS